ncbi:MAG: hypothetical protein ACI8RD_009734, partial [Bacillariaceae sp.]|jgi:hypothetical protein
VMGVNLRRIFVKSIYQKKQKKTNARCMRPPRRFS